MAAAAGWLSGWLLAGWLAARPALRQDFWNDFVLFLPPCRCKERRISGFVSSQKSATCFVIAGRAFLQSGQVFKRLPRVLASRAFFKEVL